MKSRLCILCTVCYMNMVIGYTSWKVEKRLMSMNV